MSQSKIRSPGVVSLGIVAVGIVVAISSFGIVRAERMKPNAGDVFRCSSGKACVEAISDGSSTYGLFASSLGIAVKAQSGGGSVAVEGNAITGSGVYGKTQSQTGNAGLSGLSSSPKGTGYGVYGESGNGAGVYGVSNGGSNYQAAGVYGSSDTESGVVAESRAKTNPTLYALNDNRNGEIFLAYDPPNNSYCTIDAHGDLTCTGTITGHTLLTQQRTDDGRSVLTYSAQSATATIEDVGTSRMRDGVADVQIEPTFASAMDGRWYYVFLTPLGDTRGLYVSRKTRNAFEVREVMHGHGDLDFDYRIVANPLGVTHERLPLAPSDATLLKR